MALGLGFAIGCGGGIESNSAPVSPAPAPASVEVPSGQVVADQPSELVSDEGMWLLNEFPSERLGRRHGFTPSQDWLDELRLASVRLAGGCSGSFVSPGGLVMTNHHCAVKCIQQVSTKRSDYLKDGFVAKRSGEELRCPEVELNQLVEIADVTSKVLGSMRGKAEAAGLESRRVEISKIEKECATSDVFRCDVVSLFHGGRYHLYKYRRYQDVRLVFAPEKAIASFGGDPDNFNFPRYSFDVAFLRVYVDGKAAETPHYLRWSAKGASEGDLTFVSGHPGTTSRMMTVSQLEYARDHRLPFLISWYSEVRGAVREFQKLGTEHQRMSSTTLWGAENSLKALRGRRQALVDAGLIGRKRAEERDLRARVDVDPELKGKYGDAWDGMALAQDVKRGIRDEYEFVEGNSGVWSVLMDYARIIVRGVEEYGKPNGERIRRFSDSNRPAVEQQLYSKAPIFDDFEIMKLTMSLSRMREFLGADHEVVRAVLGKKSPDQVARDVVKGTKLGDVEERRRLLSGGKSGVEVSQDAAVVLARVLEPYARSVRGRYEREVEAVEVRHGERIAAARFAVFGTSVYPDATFSLRLSFGTVQGWDEGGVRVGSFTTVGGLFDRATGSAPFALPGSWVGARGGLDMSTRMNLVTSNDVIGGNSGSPLVNRDREVVGLVFDGNIHSLGGEYVYDGRVNRTVSVHSSVVLEALSKVYGADLLVGEVLGR